MKQLTLRAKFVVILLLISSITLALTPIKLSFETSNGQIELLYFKEYLDLYNGIEETDTAKVERIIDGCHINVSIGYYLPCIRLIGNQLPQEDNEIGSNYLYQANQLVKKLLSNNTVQTTYGTLRQDSISNLLAFLWLPVEYESERHYISLNLLLLANGLAEFENSNIDDERMAVALFEGREYAKTNLIGFWKESEKLNFKCEAPILEIKSNDTVRRRLYVKIMGTQDMAYAGTVQVTKYMGNIKKNLKIDGHIPHMYFIDLDKSWDNQYFSITVDVKKKSKGDKLKVVVLFNDKVIDSKSLQFSYQDSVYLSLWFLKYKL